MGRPMIDKLIPGTITMLRFKGRTFEYAKFIGITGDGDSRRAEFEQFNPSGEKFRWEAYRYNGGWAYGTGADRLGVEHVYGVGGTVEAYLWQQHDMTRLQEVVTVIDIVGDEELRVESTATGARFNVKGIGRVSPLK